MLFGFISSLIFALCDTFLQHCSPCSLVPLGVSLWVLASLFTCVFWLFSTLLWSLVSHRFHLCASVLLLAHVYPDWAHLCNPFHLILITPFCSLITLHVSLSCQPLSFVMSYAGLSLLCCCSWLNSTVFLIFVFRWCVFCLFVGVYFVDFKTAHFLLVEVCLSAWLHLGSHLHTPTWQSWSYHCLHQRKTDKVEFDFIFKSPRIKHDMFSKPFCWLCLNDEDILTIKTFYSHTIKF